jgi:hypothetical protein
LRALKLAPRCGRKPTRFCSLEFWFAFSGMAQAVVTWLNLLSVQPPRAHIISFPRLAREAHGTHSLKRAIKDPGVSTGSVTLQIVSGKIIGRLFDFALR